MLPSSPNPSSPPPLHSMISAAYLTRSEAPISQNNGNILHIPPPQYLLLGDSRVRFLSIPNCVTYSYSGAKILDLLHYIPNTLQQHPSVHTVIINAGINDIRCKQSAKMRTDYEAIAVSIEDLGKNCIFSGLFPTLYHSSESFSRLYSIDKWLCNFCQACGYGYIDLFDSFWKRTRLYRDKLHPNDEGLKTLASKISSHLTNIDI